MNPDNTSRPDDAEDNNQERPQIDNGDQTQQINPPQPPTQQLTPAEILAQARANIPGRNVTAPQQPQEYQAPERRGPLQPQNQQAEEEMRRTNEQREAERQEARLRERRERDERRQQLKERARGLHARVAEQTDRVQQLLEDIETQDNVAQGITDRLNAVLRTLGQLDQTLRQLAETYLDDMPYNLRQGVLNLRAQQSYQLPPLDDEMMGYLGDVEGREPQVQQLWDDEQQMVQEGTPGLDQHQRERRRRDKELQKRAHQLRDAVNNLEGVLTQYERRAQQFSDQLRDLERGLRQDAEPAIQTLEEQARMRQMQLRRQLDHQSIFLQRLLTRLGNLPIVNAQQGPSHDSELNGVIGAIQADLNQLGVRATEMAEGRVNWPALGEELGAQNTRNTQYEQRVLALERRERLEREPQESLRRSLARLEQVALTQRTSFQHLAPELKSEELRRAIENQLRRIQDAQQRLRRLGTEMALRNRDEQLAFRDQTLNEIRGQLPAHRTELGQRQRRMDVLLQLPERRDHVRSELERQATQLRQFVAQLDALIALSAGKSDAFVRLHRAVSEELKKVEQLQAQTAPTQPLGERVIQEAENLMAGRTRRNQQYQQGVEEQQLGEWRERALRNVQNMMQTLGRQMTTFQNLPPNMRQPRMLQDLNNQGMQLAALQTTLNGARTQTLTAQRAVLQAAEPSIAQERQSLRGRGQALDQLAERARLRRQLMRDQVARTALERRLTNAAQMFVGRPHLLVQTRALERRLAHHATRQAALLNSPQDVALIRTQLRELQRERQEDLRPQVVDWEWEARRIRLDRALLQERDAALDMLRQLGGLQLTGSQLRIQQTTLTQMLNQHVIGLQQQRGRLRQQPMPVPIEVVENYLATHRDQRYGEQVTRLVERDATLANVRNRVNFTTGAYTPPPPPPPSALPWNANVGNPGQEATAVMVRIGAAGGITPILVNTPQPIGRQPGQPPTPVLGQQLVGPYTPAPFNGDALYVGPAPNGGRYFAVYVDPNLTPTVYELPLRMQGQIQALRQRLPGGRRQFQPGDVVQIAAQEYGRGERVTNKIEKEVKNIFRR